MRNAEEIGDCLEIFIKRYDLGGRKQILILFADKIRNSIRDVQEGRQLDCPKKVLLLCFAVLVESEEMVDILMRVLKYQPSSIDLLDYLF